MKKKSKSKLTLDRLARYEIRVPGHLDESWLEWIENATMTTETGDGDAITTLICTMDQAALIGILRRLYSLGNPLMSVIWVEDE